MNPWATIEAKSKLLSATHNPTTYKETKSVNNTSKLTRQKREKQKNHGSQPVNLKCHKFHGKQFQVELKLEQGDGLNFLCKKLQKEHSTH